MGELHGHDLAALAYGIKMYENYSMGFWSDMQKFAQTKISRYTVQEPDTLIDTKQEAISYRSICHVAS